MRAHTRRLLLAIWFCFTVRAIFYCSVFPMWEGFDEYSHFAVIQHVAFGRDLPDPRTSGSSRQVEHSLKLVPLPWMMHKDADGLLSHEAYWRLPPGERKIREAELRHLPSEWAAESSLPLYEAQQPPLYYWLMSIVMGAIRRLDLPSQVWMVRCAGALLASMIIPIAFVTARRVLRSDEMSLGIALVIACMPELLITFCRVGNESLALVLGGLVILLALRWADSPSAARSALFGLALGAALLTKAYFLALLPLLAVVPLWVYRASRSRRSATALQALVAFAACSAVCGWWYARTMLLTGSITGEQTEVAARMSTGASFASAVWSISWRRVFDVLAISHIWLGNWSFLVVRRWMYRVIETVFAVAFLGIIRQTFWPRPGLSQPRDLLVLAIPYATLLAGLCYQAVGLFRVSGTAGTMGYYLYCLVVPEALLVLVGLARWLPPGWSLYPVPFLAAVFLALECFGMWCLQLPYYAGLISHDMKGNLPAFVLSRLGGGGIRTLFENLSANKPEFLTPGILMVAAILYLCASAGLLCIAFVLAKASVRRSAEWIGVHSCKSSPH